jgi:hypothetical protein
MKLKEPDPAIDEIELHSDAWERFERAVKLARGMRRRTRSNRKSRNRKPRAARPLSAFDVRGTGDNA